MYTFNSRVRYSELDHQRGTLSCHSIINYFQDCSTFQSEDVNRGLSYMQSINRVWILNSWQLEILKPATLGAYITAGTWAYDFKGFYGYRNFVLKNQEEEVIAAANSIWVYLDAETGHPIKVPTNNTGYNLEPSYPMDYANRKVEIPQNVTSFPSFTIKKSNIDTYSHVNNGQYIKMAEEYLPDSFNVSSMRVEYRLQAVLGDLVKPLISEEANCIKVILANKEDKPFAVVEFQSKLPD